MLVATILSAQCTDERVNRLTPPLFAKYKTAADFASADPRELEAAIRPAGFFRNKARSIIGASRKIVSDFNGRVPDTMEELLTLPGVARKTANIVLSSAYGKAEGIAVDVHVARLAGRLGLSRERVPVKIERDLLKIVPRQALAGFQLHAGQPWPGRLPGPPAALRRVSAQPAVPFGRKIRGQAEGCSKKEEKEVRVQGARERRA